MSLRVYALMLLIRHGLYYNFFPVEKCGLFCNFFTIIIFFFNKKIVVCNNLSFIWHIEINTFGDGSGDSKFDRTEMEYLEHLVSNFRNNILEFLTTLRNVL